MTISLTIMIKCNNKILSIKTINLKAIKIIKKIKIMNKKIKT